MRWAIVDPRGIEAALSDPTPGPEVLRERLPESFLPRFHAPAPSGADYVKPLQRLAIYAEGFFDRLVEVLQNDFTDTLGLLGEESFRELVSEYLCAYPSRSYTAADVGQFLSRYVEESRWKERDGLLDAVRMDWAKLESFFSTPAAPFDLAAFFQSLSPEDSARVRLELDPSVRLMETQAGCWLISWGESERLPAAPYKVLQALRVGKALGDLDPEVLDLSADEVSSCFNEYFPKWAAKRIVARAYVPV